MLEYYANQSITLKQKGAINAFNEPTYTTVTIQGRAQYKRKIVRNTQGQEVLSESQIFTASAVVSDDLIVIDGIDYPVISVEKIADLDGVILWYEVYL